MNDTEGGLCEKDMKYIDGWSRWTEDDVVEEEVLPKDLRGSDPVHGGHSEERRDTGYVGVDVGSVWYSYKHRWWSVFSSLPQ